MGQANSRQEEFWEACGYGRIHKVKELIAQGININWVSYTHDSCPIHVASQGKTEIVKLLLEAGCNINVKDERGSLALHHAAMRGHADIMKLLIDAGSEINTQDKNGWTPLHNAAYWCHPNAVKVLIEAGSDVTTLNKDLRNSLHEACRSQSEDEASLGEVARMLIDAGCDINLKSSDEGEADFTPLMFASYHGHPEVARALIKAKCELNAHGTNKWTCLHWATDRSHGGVVKVLLEAGVDHTRKGTRGELPVDRAKTKEIQNLFGQQYQNRPLYISPKVDEKIDTPESDKKDTSPSKNEEDAKKSTEKIEENKPSPVKRAPPKISRHQSFKDDQANFGKFVMEALGSSMVRNPRPPRRISSPKGQGQPLQRSMSCGQESDSGPIRFIDHDEEIEPHIKAADKESKKEIVPKEKEKETVNTSEAKGKEDLTQNGAETTPDEMKDFNHISRARQDDLEKAGFEKEAESMKTNAPLAGSEDMEGSYMQSTTPTKTQSPVKESLDVGIPVESPAETRLDDSLSVEKDKISTSPTSTSPASKAAMSPGEDIQIRHSFPPKETAESLQQRTMETLRLLMEGMPPTTGDVSTQQNASNKIVNGKTDVREEERIEVNENTEETKSESFEEIKAVDIQTYSDIKVSQVHSEILDEACDDNPEVKKSQDPIGANCEEGDFQLTKAMREWSVGEVGQWLESLGLDSKSLNYFVTAKIQGHMLQNLTLPELKKLTPDLASGDCDLVLVARDAWIDMEKQDSAT